MRDSTKTIRNTGTVFTHGVTRRSTQGGGHKANNTVSGCSSLKRARKSLAYGKTARSYDGFPKRNANL